ncbi:hypothetical protein VM1G_04206 [Cytospora mali]|uniref:Zn(2)-C6 fungal-type domain-containing protein n=1 Tax=Cytospora mali TaxID=578113 RepID=A0A194VWQ8_CYTMA|nr:hypothetical protein VM1G_04206 [Valsa mali]
MNYTRKRALLACDFCRHRKRRCDGKQPCSTCREASADCVYKELPTDRIEPSSSSQGAVVERLSRIEALLEEQGQKLSEMSLTAYYGSTPASLHSFRSSPLIPAASPASVSNRSQEGDDTSLENTQFLIPRGHTTTLIWLLSLPAVRSVIGDFPENYFHELEENSPLPRPLDLVQPMPLDWPSLEPGLLRKLSNAYFENVSPHLPLFTRQYYEALLEDFMANGPTEDIESAICLCVCALGCISSHSTEASGHLTDCAEDLGLRLFQPALRVILSKTVWGFGSSIQICQALVLAGTYFSYMGRPLHSWKMVYYAGHKFLQLVNDRSSPDQPDQYDESYLRAFWCCFIAECDRVAELDVVRSGIEPLSDKVPLPRNVEASDHDDLIYFVAETAIRRLINRIHSSLYSPDNVDIMVLAESAPAPNNPGLNNILTISSELNRQLEQHYNSIPVQPHIMVDPGSNDRRRILNFRYHHARHLIYRLFVLYIVLQPQQQPSPIPLASSSRSPTPQQGLYPLPRIILEKCHVCIQSGEALLHAAADILDKRSPYLWSVFDVSASCLIVLFLASRSPYLRHLTPDIDALASLVVPKMRKWATPGSSLESELRIVDMLLASRYR